LDEQNIHKALSSPARREIILFLGKGKKYLTQISEEVDKAPQTVDFHINILQNNGLVGAESEHGKKFYYLKDKSILRFLQDGRPLPPRHHPKPPHEVVLDAQKQLNGRMDAIEEKIDLILKKLK